MAVAPPRQDGTPRTRGGAFFRAAKELGKARVQGADYFRLFYFPAPRS